MRDRDAWEPVVLPLAVGLLAGSCLAFMLASWLRRWAEVVWETPDGLAEAVQHVSVVDGYAQRWKRDGASGASH